MLRQIIKPDGLRPLALRAERIDPKFLVAGKPPDAQVRIDPDRPWERPEFRHYRIDGLPWPVRVQLNWRDPAEDAERLRDAAESVLEPLPELMGLPTGRAGISPIRP